MFTFLQSSLFQIGLSNAVLATGLAFVVFLITWKSKWPAWSHALWVLVLVKLLAPPIYWISAELPAASTQFTVLGSQALQVPSAISEEQSAIEVNVIEANTSPTVALHGGEFAAPNQSSWRGKSSTLWLAIVWIIGATGVLGLTIYRYAKFKRWLRMAKSAPAELVDVVSSVAHQVGLARAPKVLLVRGVISPSVYSLGCGASLLLPVGLVNQLSERELRSIIAHELTHLRRGDHWVRLLEMAAGAIFWWHPIVSFTRRRIHEAADESCDAGVISRDPSAGRDYASAMLKTVDYLSGASANREGETAVMPLMIAIGDSCSLQRRMRQIRRSTASPSVSPRGWVALAAAAMVLLPFGMLPLGPIVDAAQPPVQESPASDITPAENRDALQAGGASLDDPLRSSGKLTSRDSDPFGSDEGGPFDDSDDPFASNGSDDPTSTVSVVDPFADENRSAARASSTTIPLGGNQRSNAERNQAVEDRLRTALRSEQSHNFPEVRLMEAISLLSQVTDLPFIIDRIELERMNITSDTPVSVSLDNVRLSSFLQLMLRDLDLTYMIKDEVILITSVAYAEKNPTLKTYVLPAELSERSEKILAALTSNVKPDIWKDAGGSSTASAIDNVLIVSTTEAVHDEVETFLQKIESAFKVYQQKQNAVVPVTKF